MATTKENKDISALNTKVAVIDEKLGALNDKFDEFKETAASNNKSILDKMDKFAYVAQKDYNKDMDTVNKRLGEIEKLVFAGGVKIANALNSGVSKAIIGALVLAILVAIVVYLPKLFPAIGGQG